VHCNLLPYCVDSPSVSVQTPTTSSPSKVYSLTQVAQSIRLALERATANRSWLVKAEILKISEGLGQKTVYLDLVEEQGGRQTAKMRGVIWPQNGAEIRSELGGDTSTILKAGSEVVFSARIQFHERFGLSLFIDRVDLRHMLGEMERRKQATLAQLKKLGALNWNKRIALCALPQKVAVIGSPGTSGFRDFITKTLGHPSHFKVQLELFASGVQGAAAPEQLKNALLLAQASQPDLIVMVRGGGSKLDLDAFNDFSLCEAIASSTVPVWTGIGHESDLVVADLVAQRALKTPTDVAVALTDMFEEVAHELELMAQAIERRFKLWNQGQQSLLSQCWKTLEWAGKNTLAQRQMEIHGFQKMLTIQGFLLIDRQRKSLEELERRCLRSGHQLIDFTRRELQNDGRRIHQATHQQLQHKRIELNRTQSVIRTLHPAQTLKRGFMLLKRGNTLLTATSEARIGEVLQLEGKDGSIPVRIEGNTNQLD
jgi:exodeoxyribonuclease VII large subunit